MATKIGAPIALALAGVAAVAGLVATKEKPAPATQEERVWPVAAGTLDRRTLTPQIVVFGEIVAGRAAELRPLVAGPIVSIADALREGGEVPAEFPLMTIDPFEYEIALDEADAEAREARARLAELESEVSAERQLLASDESQQKLRERDFIRRRDLRQRGAGTQKAADDAELALAEARQATISRRQTVVRLEAMIDQQIAMVDRADAALRRAERNLADSILVAPFAGVLTEVADVAPGKRMGVGDPVAKLIDVDRLEARVQLPDADFARLLGPAGDPASLIGAQANVTWKIGGAGYRFPARIQRIGAELDAASGGVDVFLAVESDDVGALRPGAFVEAAFSDRPLEDVFVIPADALTMDGALHLIGADDRLEAARPKVLRRLGDRVAIDGDWADGTRFVAKRFPEIGPGLKVLAR